MIDNLTLLLSHGLILLTCWRLLSRADLDTDRPDPDRGLFRPRSASADTRRDAGDA
ncbi:hypothetical protein LWE61_14280 [Sphingobium sufflavum]|uniref:hypothetical protein n=1 Tax=Sphingobium sufflavum TaxID=1129547 RepID=UPI001F2C7974|nr:hypothetical protein [Sphingobium sufflavum]MCE7797714.1 hypothetical protein [Sphingobium sufflavum]